MNDILKESILNSAQSELMEKINRLPMNMTVNDNLTNKLTGNEGQCRDKPGYDLRKIDYVVFGGDEITHFRFSQLINLSIFCRQEADDFIRLLRFLKCGKHALI